MVLYIRLVQAGNAAVMHGFLAHIPFFLDHVEVPERSRKLYTCVTVTCRTFISDYSAYIPSLLATTMWRMGEPEPFYRLKRS